MTLQATTSKSACIDIPSPYDMELIELYDPHKIPTLMRPTKFPEIPVSLERNTEVFRHPLL